MEKKQVDKVNLHSCKALLEGALHCLTNFGGWSITHVVLRSDSETRRQAAMKGIAQDSLRFTVSVTGGHIDKRDAGVDSLS